MQVHLKTIVTTLLLAVCFSAHTARAAVLDRDTVEYYYRQAEKLYQKGDHRQALELFETAFSYIRPRSGKVKEYQYSELLDYIATLKCEFGEVDTAIEIEKQVVEWREQNKCDYGVIGVAISKLAVFYSYKKDYDTSIRYAEQAAELLRRRYGEKDHVYAVNEQNLASYYSLRGASPQDYQKAVQLAEHAVKYIDNYSPEYAYALNNLVIYYSQAENPKKAQELTSKAISKGRSIFGKHSLAYADVLASQAVRLANIKNYSQAIDYSLEARSIYDADSVHNNVAYARLLNSLGSFCKQAERFDLGIESLQHAQAIYQSLGYETTQEYVNCVSNLAAIYRMKGDMEHADEVASQAEQLLTSTDDVSNYKTFGKSLSEQGWMYAAAGDFQRAIDFESRALKVFTENADSANVAQSMSDLSSHYFNSGQHERGISLCQDAISLMERNNLHDTALGRALNNLAIFHYRSGDHQKALQLSRAAVRNYEEQGDTHGSMYSRILTNLAMFYYLNDSLDMAISISQRSLDIQSQTLGQEHPDLVVAYHNLANYYLAKGDTKTMRTYFERAMQMQAYDVRNNFSHLTTTGRELYWNTKSYIFKIAPILASRTNGDPALCCDAYNALLFTKGILLNSEIDFENFLMKTGKTELLDKYSRLEAMHKRIDDYKHSASFDSSDLDRLQREANQLERELVRGCKEFGDFTSNLTITFDQVADSLAPDAAAVEFVDTPMEGGDRLYSALVLRHGWKQPQLLPLFSWSEIVGQDFNGQNLTTALRTPKGINAVYNHPQVGHLIWYPIMELLGTDVHDIYFSPTGMLYQIGIEYVRINPDQRISDRYALHRLSSTKSIAQTKSNTSVRSAAIYGGLSYDIDSEQMVELHKAYATPADNLLAMNSVETTRALNMANSVALDSLSRAGLVATSLPGTLTEANDVASVLRSRGVNTKLYTEEQGTEESFKALSGKGLSLIHIATHGFYFSDNELQRNKSLIRLMGQENSETADEDRSMLYSGLMLAGVNTLLRGRRLPEGVENGVLTSKEISMLDLRGLDLVVLSACQTGQGELKEDGVYGLQRAFKKAGAQTLLMSLWSVSDAATQVMMTSFYNALSTGLSRYEAFRSAQASVRSAGYTDPFFWASFVMLDAGE